MIPSIKKLANEPASSVILLLMLVSLPHFKYIPLTSALIIIALLCWRVLVIFKKKFRPAKLLMFFFTLLLAAIVFQHAGSYSGITAGSHLLVVMSFLKLLESTSERDYRLLVILSIFIIATNFLFSQSFYTALYMCFCIFITLITLLSINQKSTQTSLTEKIKSSLKMMALSLPLMIIAFVFFPRINGQLWHTNSQTSHAKTGLSESMEPGQISQLVFSNELVFRARFNSALPENKQLYWRAMTLWDYDGKKWQQISSGESETQIHLLSPPHQYTVTVEANNNKWLYLLDLPVTLSQGFMINTDFTARLTQPARSLFQYSASSASDYYLSNQLDADIRQIALRLPGLNIKTAELARRWQQNSASTEDIIKKALNYFSQENFYYTLSPPRLTTVASTDQFLFESREGFCEHYASAFAVLMRAAGVPSRIVQGYLGGKFNPYNGIISVDQSMAHAWNEVWIAHKGWVRIDPTAAIAPERINKDINAALKDQPDLPLHLKIDFAALNKIRQFIDLIDNQWNQWILNYNDINQKKFLEKLSRQELTLADISQLFIKFMLGALILTVMFFYLTTKRQKTDPVTKAYQRFLLKAERAGLKKQKSEGPSDFNRRLQLRFPHLKKQITQIIDLYIELKFQKSSNASTAQRFIRAVQHLKIRKK